MSINTSNQLPRDAFIDTLFDDAIESKDIYFMSADLGAKALDRWRTQIPSQFIHVGICEQNMMDVAAGMAQNGKRVYTYAMAPFITSRCYEQIKVALSATNVPVTLIGVGVGFGYDDAGPTHYATEDISCVRALPEIEIISPSDHRSVIRAAKDTLDKPGLRYIRLDRKFLPDVYANQPDSVFDDGVAVIAEGKDVAIISTGFMIQSALKVRENLASEGISAAVIDVFRLWPFNGQKFKSLIENHSKLITIEEHSLAGGLGSIVIESISDLGAWRPTLRLGIPDQFFFENGGRNHIHELAQIDVGSLTRKSIEFARY